MMTSLSFRLNSTSTPTLPYSPVDYSTQDTRHTIAPSKRKFVSQSRSLMKMSGSNKFPYVWLESWCAKYNRMESIVTMTSLVFIQRLYFDPFIWFRRDSNTWR